jgi:molybdenum cofactor synthesis domain-containing protein
LVITGNEVYHGLIEDRFAPILTEKVEALGSQVDSVALAPDDAALISEAIRSHLDRGCDLLMLSGGMSVDPDDVTRQGIRSAGATEMHYGASVLPGAMLWAMCRCWGCRPAGCFTALPCWIWCCPGFWPVKKSARPSWHFSVMGACARIVNNAFTRIAHLEKASKKHFQM